MPGIKGVAPKCRACGEHPRSASHRSQCGPPKPVKRGMTRETRRQERIQAEVAEATDAFVPGRTCICCWRQRSHFPPDQLPNTSEAYPLCAQCLYYTRRVLENGKGK